MAQALPATVSARPEGGRRISMRLDPNEISLDGGGRGALRQTEADGFRISIVFIFPGRPSIEADRVPLLPEERLQPLDIDLHGGQMTLSDSDPVAQAFGPIIGLPAWGVDKGQESMLSFEFGDPHLLISEPRVPTSSPAAIRKQAARRRVRPSGAWFLFIYGCQWRVIVDGIDIASNASSDAAIRDAVRTMDGQRLLSVSVDPARGTSRFGFDLGAVFLTWPRDDDEEQWSLSMRDGHTLGYRADGHYRWQPTRGSDDEVWLPYPPAARTVA